MKKQTRRSERVVAMVDQATKDALERQRDKVAKATGVKPSLSSIAAQALARSAAR